MKLSEIWQKANEELKQGQGWEWNYVDDTHCALGAVIHYLFGHGRCEERYWRGLEGPGHDHKVCVALTQIVEPFVSKVHRPITALNDGAEWTFEQFAEEAKRLGL